MPKIDKPKKGKRSRIPIEATQLKTSYDDDFGRFAFSSVCENHCLLEDWQKAELERLIYCFKKIESLTWKQIKKDSGLDYESHSYIAVPRPQTLPPDASLDSIRVNLKMRLFGYRTQNVFNIIWFDKNHIVCPEDKTKKYAI